MCQVGAPPEVGLFISQAILDTKMADSLSGKPFNSNIGPLDKASSRKEYYANSDASKVYLFDFLREFKDYFTRF